ncbi:MAG TPA: glycosyltransferase family 1 protein [Rhodospirillales bacterium]|nr:glycosyltransferase family 1 protein [Rhodospirillales bacterium]
MSSRFRIAHVYPHARIGSGNRVTDAISIVLHEFCRRLAREHEVSAWVRRMPGQPAVERTEGFTVHHLPVGADRLLNGLMLLDRLGLTPTGRPSRTWPTYYLPFALRLGVGLRRRNVGVVHLHSVAGLLPLLRRLLPEAVIGLHVHDHSLADFSPGWGRGCLRTADFALTCSHFVGERIRRHLGDGIPPLHTLHNGVDRRFFACQSDPGGGRRIVFVGRLAPEKGVHLLIEAFARIADRFPDATLDLVGPAEFSPPEFVDPWRRDPLLRPLAPFLTRPGSYGEELRRRAASLGDRVRFRGAVDNARLPSLLAGAAVLVMPSLWEEPFGIPVIEAMAAGLPVVASDAGAFPETVAHDRTGLLVSRGDSEALAAALDRLLADPELRRRFGVAGRTRARELFTWNHLVVRLEVIYREAAERRARAAGDTGSDCPLAVAGR